MLPVAHVIHHLSMIIFFGNIISTYTWKRHAERSQNPTVICHALTGSLLMDKAITIPASVVVTLSGVLLIILKGVSILSHLWLQLSIALWLVSAISAVRFLVPSLSQLQKIAEAQRTQDSLDSSYYYHSKRWDVLSLLLIISPMVILILMIVKPS
ncbi:hypothetical protein IAD21_06407 (plasmid) [Abditibacteriota bacterium]|nr:hypothetical protein IAD21_06407 [Abditibacteriota bacterium]